MSSCQEYGNGYYSFHPCLVVTSKESKNLEKKGLFRRDFSVKSVRAGKIY